MFKRIIQLKLRYLAKKIIKKYNPKVIGITGSVGKTSSRDAIYSVLKTKFIVRKSIKNYNNELGVPLSIIGAKSPGKNIFGWFNVIFLAAKLILFKDSKYPEVLILEMGVDRVGDMDYLSSIVKCDIGVITMIGQSHLEFFKTINAVQKEKGKLIENIKKEGWAILNFDNKEANELAGKSKVKVLKFGLNNNANINANNIILKFSKANNTELKDLLGLSFKLKYDGADVPIILSGVISEPAIYAALSGACVGIALGMNIVDISEGLRNFNSPNGRMKLIEGIKDTLIIDDTYNASPQSSVSAINSVKRISVDKKFRKIAIWGEMLELGVKTEELHSMVGSGIAKAKFDMLIVVGERARDIRRGALKAKMNEKNIFYFETTREAGKFIQDKMKTGDLILIKGSQGSRMEKIVKEIMAEPLRAKELLVRQDSEWT